jgi:4-aminobutyrate aminotransferase/(S)-3-amino-2-methylpropionate transaminase
MSNAELSALRAEVVPRGVPSVAPVFIAKARNAVITDVDGREYIDFAAGIGVMNVGHCHPKVVEAAKEQAELYSHTHELRRRGRGERGQDRPVRHGP